VPMRPIIGGITTPSPKISVNHPNNLFDREMRSRLLSELFGTVSWVFILY
jgi:hypothetical protein